MPRKTRPTPDTFAVRLAQAMDGMTGYRLAKRSGLGTATIHDLLAGKYLPQLDTAAKLARALDVSLADLAPPVEIPADTP